MPFSENPSHKIIMQLYTDIQTDRHTTEGEKRQTDKVMEFFCLSDVVPLSENPSHKIIMQLCTDRQTDTPQRERNRQTEKVMEIFLFIRCSAIFSF